MRKIWGLLAGVLAALCMCNVYEVYAGDTQVTAYSESSVFDDADAVIDYLNDRFLEQDDEIVVILSDDLCKDSVPTDKFLELLNMAAMYYETSGSSYSYTNVSEGTKFTLYPTYKLSEEQHAQMLQAIDAAVKSLNLNGKSEYQKVRAIHDYICDKVDYDFTYTKYSAYDAIIGGKVVCQGYANLFYCMCKKVDVDAELITGIGNGGNHAWNIVRIGDVYYDIDATWDGQDVETDHTFFLKSENEFSDHYRNAKFDTDEYHKKHPMALGSWMDFSKISETESIDNIDCVYFNTIDGGTVSNRAENNRPKILFFGSTKGCTNTSNTFAEISAADFKDVDIVFIDANYADLTTVQTFKSNYGNGNSSIVYSYSEGYSNLSVMWDYAETVGLDLKYFPLIVYIDADNKIQYVDASSLYSAVHVRNIVNTYLHHNDISSISANNVTVDVKASVRLYVDVYGVERNAQFFTWSSSDTSVATVDANGVIKGIKEGTATITCKINDSISHTCNVKVNEAKIADGLNIGYDGVWGYYKNGVVDTGYTGMAKNAYGWWYVKNGYLDRTYTGMANNEYGWWYMKKGKLDTTYTGMLVHNSKWIYVKAGKFDTGYTGMAKNSAGWWYVKNGVLDRTYTGMAAYGSELWYVKAGKFTSSYTGMFVHNGKWIYVKAGKFDTGYTGMAKNSAGWWYMKNGILDRTYTGMAKNEYGWWYMKNGKLDTTYTGMAKNEYGWWYMKNGKIDTTYTGMAKNEFGWWYMKNGKLDSTYIGLASNGYGTWYMKNGKLDTSYSGTITFKGKTYTIKNGKVV